MDLSSLSKLQTEGVNPRTTNIDQMSTLEMCAVINGDDHLVAESIIPCLPVIAGAIDDLASRVRKGGRVVYVGAGTSGRLGILDASEIPPTFAAPQSQFIGLIAGGDEAIRQAQEGAEDNEQAGHDDLNRLNLNPELDSVIGIASSGRTPYVLGCLAFAKKLNCLTIGVVCTSPSAMARLKAGTATKMVLNMLSTGTMIKSGKTYGNMMVDMVASNLKLEQRSRNMLRRLSGKCNARSDSELDSLLSESNGSVKLAILVAETGESVQTCQQSLDSAEGILSKALAGISQPNQPHIHGERQFVLCIDGGGSKCAAVVADKSGVMSYGSAGPCNLTDNIENIDGILATLTQATLDALRKHSSCANEGIVSNERSYLQSCFQSVWIGLAGMDRAGLHHILAPRLAKLFGLEEKQMTFKLTNDVNLLTALGSADERKPSILVLIAGTGSVAIRYNWSDNKSYNCVARAGGWGHLLGDEGGGYSIGLEAVRHTLDILEQRKLGLGPNNLSGFDQAVLDKLGCSFGNNDDIDLLSEILSQRGTQSAKARIAGLAETVSELEDEKIAQAIIDQQGSAIVSKTLGRLVDPRSSGYVAPEETELVLVGGLFKNKIYQQKIQQILAHKGLKFRGIQVVYNVAGMVAKYMVSQRID
ncbi:uncharacterized protein N7483_008593 [Penicillium malachiteum]|uniref:uncharacterized protein n=1 Tax=Penicillium malachiteum TaxID=1324776 RepID=UPI0025494FDD|nr:uncharacterized protein N7483_008593 [Penicillium malachiteum]KAJ5720659.1 hypothetical protein N7483_008593 [Penicillium malachiteum]